MEWLWWESTWDLPSWYTWGPVHPRLTSTAPGARLARASQHLRPCLPPPSELLSCFGATVVLILCALALPPRCMHCAPVTGFRLMEIKGSEHPHTGGMKARWTCVLDVPLWTHAVVIKHHVLVRFILAKYKNTELCAP